MLVLELLLDELPVEVEESELEDLVEVLVEAVAEALFDLTREEGTPLDPTTMLEAPAGRDPWVGMTGVEVTAAEGSLWGYTWVSRVLLRHR